MNNNRLLRRHISNLINTVTLTDDHVIEGICQLLNIKYLLEEHKEQPKINHMMFGKTYDEILRALEFYDKHSEQTVQDDLTFSEAVEKVYAIQKRYAPGVDKKWIEAQLDSFAVLGLIKFKEIKDPLKDYLTVSSVVRNQIKTVFIHHSLIEHIGDKLREACIKQFGNAWSNDIARIFARIAIEEYELQKAKDNK